MMLNLILLVAAFILSVLAAIGVGPPRVHLGWAAMACWFLSLIAGHLIR